jgi:hypothetical protein
MLFWFKLRLSGSRNAAESKGVSLAYDIGCVLQPDKQAKRSDQKVWQLCKCAAPCWLSIMIYKSNVHTDTNIVVSKPEQLVGRGKGLTAYNLTGSYNDVASIPDTIVFWQFREALLSVKVT